MDITAIPMESLIAIPALAAAVYVIKSRKPKPSLLVKKTTYDRKTNKIIMHIENKKPICYSLKSAIKLSRILPEIQTEEGMSPASAFSRSSSNTLIAEDKYPIVIGPNELIEISYTPIVPRDFLDQYNLTNLDVSINFSKYEDIQHIASKELFEEKLKEQIDKLKPPIFGNIINEKRIGSSILYKNMYSINLENEDLIPKALVEFDRLELLNKTVRYSFGNELIYYGKGKIIGNNTTIWHIDLRKEYPILMNNESPNTNIRQP